MSSLVEPHSGVLEIATGLSVPLQQAGELDGDAGFGAGAAIPTPTPLGMLVSRKRCVSLHDASFQEIWRWVAADWAAPFALRRMVLAGPLEGRLFELDLATGQVLRDIPCEGVASVQAAGDDLIVVRRVPALEAIDRLGRRLWRIEEAVGGVKLCTDDRLFIVRDGWRRLTCISAGSGDVLWEFSPEYEYGGGLQDTSSQLFAFAIVERRVIAIARNGRVFSLSVANGEVLNVGRAEFVGIPRITATSVFFVTPYGYSEFSHVEMKELHRDEYHEAVQPLYKGATPAVHAFTITNHSVIWTTRHAAMMGVSRKQDAPRKTWTHLVPGSLMPIAQHPFVFRDGLYYEAKMVNKLLRFVSKENA